MALIQPQISEKSQLFLVELRVLFPTLPVLQHYIIQHYSHLQKGWQSQIWDFENKQNKTNPIVGFTLSQPSATVHHLLQHNAVSEDIKLMLNE